MQTRRSRKTRPAQDATCGLALAPTLTPASPVSPVFTNIRARHLAHHQALEARRHELKRRGYRRGEVTMALDDEALRTALERHWAAAGKDADIEQEIYHDDAVLEFPQSGERFEGVPNFKA